MSEFVLQMFLLSLIFQNQRETFWESEQVHTFNFNHKVLN